MKTPPSRRRNLYNVGLFRFSVPATGRCDDGEGFTCLQNGLVAIAKHFNRTVPAAHFVTAGLSGLAAIEAEGRHAAMPGEDGEFQPLQCSDRALGAVASAPFALAARLFPNVEIFQQYRETGFKNFRVGQA